MFIVFLVVVVTGVAGFAFVFTRAWKRLVVPVSVEPIEVPGIERSLAHESNALITLQQLVDEKNLIITDLQKGLQADDDHAAQVDRLKEIFQGEIEALKQQNRKFKEEIARLSQENLDLQTRIYAATPPRKAVVDHVGVDQEASTAFEGELRSVEVLQDVFSKGK